jgi:hypothetical protein
MTQRRAEATLRDFFAPASLEDFLAALGRHSFDVPAGPGDAPRKLFGDEPRETLLAAYDSHATQLKCYGLAPQLPPPATRPASSPQDFRELIKSFHEREYTVRIPDVIPLSPRLQEVARALETLLHQPVQAAAFWSKAEAKAIVHYDNRDNIAVQLEGKKRWFISTDPPGLQNNWKQVGEPLPQLSRYRIVDAEPGDLIYIPRGTPHTVESTSESLHLAILFVPTTVREVITAALDFLSDEDLQLRQPAFARAADSDAAALSGRVLAGLAGLAERCRSDEFLRRALDLRSSRMISSLPPLQKPAAAAQITRDTRVRHAPLAITHLRPALGTLDLTIPGEHIAIHPGVEPELRFITATDEFRVGDVPGESSDDVRIALVSRLVASGLLQVVT